MPEPTLHRGRDARTQARAKTPAGHQPITEPPEPVGPPQRNRADDPPVAVAELFSDDEGLHAVLRTGARTAGLSPKQARRARKRDRSMRRRWYQAVKRSGVSPGCKSWLYSIADRSDDTAKPVWGRQTKQGAEIDRCARSVRRYRAEAESAGLIRTIRSEPIQDPITGHWSRPHSNTYIFVIPARADAEKWRAAKQQRRSHRADRYCRSTPPTEVENPPETGAGSSSPLADAPPPPSAPTKPRRRRGKDPGTNRSGDLPRFIPEPPPSHRAPKPIVQQRLAGMRAQLAPLETQGAAQKGRP